MEPSERVEEGWINVRMIIEAQGKPERHVIRSLEAIRDQIKAMKVVEVYEVKMEPPEEQEEGLVSGLVDLGMVVKDFDVLMQLVLNYGPSATIVLEPEEIKVNFRELESAINDVSNFLHRISQENLTLRLQKVLEAKGISLDD